MPWYTGVMTRMYWHPQTTDDLVDFIVDSILSDYIFHGMVVKEMHSLRGKGYTKTSRPSLKDGLKKNVIGRLVTHFEQNGDIPAGTRKDTKIMNRITTAVLARV